MGSKMIKYEARNVVNIGNIYKFRNKVIDHFRRIRELIRGSLDIGGKADFSVVNRDRRFYHITTVR